jgi:hypothetical protein
MTASNFRRISRSIWCSCHSLASLFKGLLALVHQQLSGTILFPDFIRSTSWVQRQRVNSRSTSRTRTGATSRPWPPPPTCRSRFDRSCAAGFTSIVRLAERLLTRSEQDIAQELRARLFKRNFITNLALVYLGVKSCSCKSSWFNAKIVTQFLLNNRPNAS